MIRVMVRGKKIGDIVRILGHHYVIVNDARMVDMSRVLVEYDADGRVIEIRRELLWSVNKKEVEKELQKLNDAIPNGMGRYYKFV